MAQPEPAFEGHVRIRKSRAGDVKEQLLEQAAEKQADRFESLGNKHQSKRTTGVDVLEVLGVSSLKGISLIEITRQGLPGASITHLANRLGVKEKELSELLPVSWRTAQRYLLEEKTIPKDSSDHLIQIAKIFVRTCEVFHSEKKARAWLQERCLALGNITPFSLLDTSSGADLVLSELGRIEHGIVG